MADIDVRGPEQGSDEEQKKAPGGGLSGVAIRRPVFTAMMMFGLIVLGIFGFRRLPIDEFPDVDIPVVAVQTVYPGASPETIEREVTRRLEEAFNTVEGVDRITSNSLEGVSSVVVEFDLERDVDVASQDIRARIDGVRRDLPHGHRGAGGAEVRPLGAAHPVAGAVVVHAERAGAHHAGRRDHPPPAGVGERRGPGADRRRAGARDPREPAAGAHAGASA